MLLCLSPSGWGLSFCTRSGMRADLVTRKTRITG
jgi:hypothetical protein